MTSITSTASTASMTSTASTASAGLLGAIAVGAGAFGAHALRTMVDARDLEIWETATRYLLVHAVVLLILGLARGTWTPARHWATRLFTLGSVIFAGTLYAMVLGAPRWFGAVTPLGGLCLIAGWLAIAWYGARTNFVATRPSPPKPGRAARKPRTGTAGDGTSRRVETHDGRNG